MKAVSVLAFFGLAASLLAQQTPAPTPTPRPSDVESVDAILAAVYDVISGPAGQKRDWDRMRSLFVPDAKMMATGRRQDGTMARRAMTVEDYIKMSGPMLEERGFFEKETARKLETYGNIAHSWSSYEARQKADDKDPFMAGVNSIQLWNDGKRWWVISIFWQSGA